MKLTHTLHSANRSLVLVRRIVADLQRTRDGFRTQRRELLRKELREQGVERADLEQVVERQRNQLRALKRELGDIGAVYREGLVRFRALSSQGPLELIWKPGADALESWCHSDGVTRPISELPSDALG